MMNKQKGKELGGYELLEETQFEKDFQSAAALADKPEGEDDDGNNNNNSRPDDSALVRRFDTIFF